MSLGLRYVSYVPYINEVQSWERFAIANYGITQEQEMSVLVKEMVIKMDVDVD
jgi:hypothetical protein